VVELQYPVNAMPYTRLRHAAKALLLIGLGFFLYSRLANGTLYYYINQRFAVYTMIAIVGLLALGIAYRPQGRKAAGPAEPVDLFAAAPAENHAGRLGWGSFLLLLTPIILGLVVPPQPLGAAALSNREVSVSSSGSAIPAAVLAAAEKSSRDRNILDWLHTFATEGDPAAFDGQQATVTGFVFRDERFGEEQFMVTRFVVSCCVADANVAGLVVRWPQGAELAADQWVEVAGAFQTETFSGEPLAVLQATSVTPVSLPDQPYLYP
jgi:uncharacterized repeat protein (TIGR03943 family)